MQLNRGEKMQGARPTGKRKKERTGGKDAFIPEGKA